MDLITYATDIKGHDMRYAIDSRKLQKELGWEPSLQFAEGIEKTVSKQSLRAVLRTLIKIYTFAPNFKFGTK